MIGRVASIVALLALTAPSQAAVSVDVLVTQGFVSIQCSVDQLSFTGNTMAWRCINFQAQYSCTMQGAAIYGLDLRTIYANCIDLVTPASSTLFKDGFE